MQKHFTEIFTEDESIQNFLSLVLLEMVNRIFVSWFFSLQKHISVLVNHNIKPFNFSEQLCFKGATRLMSQSLTI